MTMEDIKGKTQEEITDMLQEPTKFKIGDEVRALTTGGFYKGFPVGSVGKVITVYPNSCVGVRFYGEFELREPAVGWPMYDYELELVKEG